MIVDVEFRRQAQRASHAPIRIMNVQHNLDASGLYTNTFEAIPAASEMPPTLSYAKPVTYPMLAEVIDNNDGKGRIRAKFMGWQQQGIAETDYMRVLTPDAGGGGDKVAANRGLVTVPEVGDQVYVDFEHGNPDRPFVTGSVFHGKVGTGGGGSNNTKSLTSKSGHTVTLNDGAGITVKDKDDNVIELDGAGNARMETKETITITCGESSISMDKNRSHPDQRQRDRYPRHEYRRIGTNQHRHWCRARRCNPDFGNRHGGDHTRYRQHKTLSMSGEKRS